jgi:hypothetical protein
LSPGYLITSRKPRRVKKKYTVNTGDRTAELKRVSLEPRQVKEELFDVGPVELFGPGEGLSSPPVGSPICTGWRSMALAVLGRAEDIGPAPISPNRMAR